MHVIDSLPHAWEDAILSERDKESLIVSTGAEAPASPLRRKSFKVVSRITGMLLGGAVGDALGMPVEGVDNRLTLRSLRRLGGIRDFLAPQHHVMRSLRKLRPGCWTDDTQLTLAITRSLIQRGVIDYDHIADAHVQAFEMLELRGWDATTKHACRRLSQGTPRTRSGKIGGSGNGIAAKIAPIAAWSLLRGETEDQLLTHCLNIGMMTHKDSRAIVGAYIVGLLVWDALMMTRGWDPSPERYDELVERARFAEDMIADAVGRSDDPLSQNLLEVSDALDSDSQELAELCGGATSYVCNSVPYITALVIGSARDFEGGVLAAVNGGGDTDTNGAIVGSILGAAYGARKLPKRFADRVEEGEIIRRTAEEFANLCVV